VREASNLYTQRRTEKGEYRYRVYRVPLSEENFEPEFPLRRCVIEKYLPRVLVSSWLTIQYP
jgi:hypothetical protein